MARLLSVCFMALFLSACAGGNKFQCGEYTVEEKAGSVSVADKSGVFDRLNPLGVAQDMENGDVIRSYANWGHTYFDVKKKDNTHERFLSVRGKKVPCLLSKP